MFNYVYSPIVKGKSNDLRAYRKAMENVAVPMKALIDVLPVPSDKTVDQHLDKFLKDLSSIPLNAPLFVDYFGFVPSQMSSNGRRAPIEGYELLKNLRRFVTPVYGFGRDETIWPLLRNVVRDHGQGFCFRIELDDLDDESENTLEKILYRSADLGLSPAMIDLFVDLRDVRNVDVDELQSQITDFLAIIPSGIEFRTICVAGCSAPKDVTAVARDSLGRIFRNELKIWARLKSDVPVCADLVYGDYGIVHPDFADNIPCGGTVNCKIRYTAGSEILIFRGHVRAGDAGQTHALAATVVAHPVFRGRDFSDGDEYIANCAIHADGPGNPSSWVFADLNHHYVYVSEQITRLVWELEIDTSLEEIDALLAEI